jgi:hypothetical protein
MTTSPKPYAVRRISPTEHQLVAARNLSAGELILCEQPIVDVPVGYYEYGTYVWDLVDRLLADKEKLLQYSRCKLLAAPLLLDKHDGEVEAQLVKKHRKSRAFVRNLYLGVGTNNVGILGQDRLVHGYGVYEFLSRSDHSCEPNAQLSPSNWRAGESGLVAKRDIRKDEPLTWCYFREAEFLPVDWVSRNYNLVNLYRFACRCPRCEAERPADVPSSQAGQVAYFDKLLYAEAKRAAQSTEGLEQLRAQAPVNIHRDRLLASGHK